MALGDPVRDSLSPGTDLHSVSTSWGPLVHGAVGTTAFGVIVGFPMRVWDEEATRWGILGQGRGSNSVPQSP